MFKIEQETFQSVVFRLIYPVDALVHVLVASYKSTAFSFAATLKVSAVTVYAAYFCWRRYATIATPTTRTQTPAVVAIYALDEVLLDMSMSPAVRLSEL
eukprot:m.156849 g.156849  ORF g.156849 m.156849 type:complete len:99 (+) comp17951_c0_seq1:117-413(+)